MTVLNIGWKALQNCHYKRADNSPDGRAGNSGRRPHSEMRTRIEKFWTTEVDTEPSHYDSTSTKLKVIGITSQAHGWLTFLCKYFHDKYKECVDAQYFPGLSVRRPDSLLADQVPVIACQACISASALREAVQIVCPHIPKLRFWQRVTSTFDLRFKRPGADQCEACNSLHNKILLLQAMGRHKEADVVANRVDKMHEALAAHHARSSAFRQALNDLQHTSKRGRGSQLPKYVYDPTVEFASKDIIQSISMDAGSGLRTPFCRVGFAYFSRVLVTNVYHIVDHGLRRQPGQPYQPYHAFLWNERAGGKGPEEMCSIFLRFITENKTGAKRCVVECDGCSGQIYNQFVFAMCSALVDPTSDLCKQLGARPGQPIFERIDIFRGEVGHTFMWPDRVHGVIRRKCRTFQSIASIQEYAEIIKRCDGGKYKVYLIEPGDGFFKDVKKYLDQSYKLGGEQKDIDNEPIATRQRHWVNFGAGPTGGDDNTTTVHRYNAWRLRCGYDPAERPIAIVCGRHTRPDRRNGEYVLLHPNLGAYERSAAGFVKFNNPLWTQKWDVAREISDEKLADTHKLACLGLSEDKIHLWPCPDPEKCKHERCPQRKEFHGIVDTVTL